MKKVMVLAVMLLSLYYYQDLGDTVDDAQTSFNSIDSKLSSMQSNLYQMCSVIAGSSNCV